MCILFLFSNYQKNVVLPADVSWPFEVYSPSATYGSDELDDEAQFFAHYDVVTQRPPGGNRIEPADYLFIEDKCFVKMKETCNYNTFSAQRITMIKYEGVADLPNFFLMYTRAVVWSGLKVYTPGEITYLFCPGWYPHFSKKKLFVQQKVKVHKKIVTGKISCIFLCSLGQDLGFGFLFWFMG